MAKYKAVRDGDVLMFDEIDALFSQRGDSDSSPTKRMKSMFLAEMRNEFSGLIMIGTTNFPERIDPAFLKRLECHYLIPLPEKNERRLMLNQTLKGILYMLYEKSLIFYAKN